MHKTTYVFYIYLSTTEKKYRMKNYSGFTVFIYCITILFSTSCKDKKTIQGDGNIITHEIPVKIFNEIKVTGAIDVIYEAKPDEAAYLSVEADDNLIPLIDIKVKGRTLIIKSKEGINPNRFVVHTNSPSLKYVESKGASNITLNGTIAGDELKIEMKGTGYFKAENPVFEKGEFKLQGAGNMEMGGQIHKTKLEISGTGDIKASDQIADEIECKIKGNGNMEVNAIEKMSIEISGNGTVSYKGNPQIIKQKIKGAGSVKVLQ